MDFFNELFCCFSDSGFGGSAGYSSSVRSSSKRNNYDSLEPPKKLDLDGLTPFEKNFYVESPSVAAMSDREVDEYRQRREITVEGRDVPKPVKSFRDIGFPGNLFSKNPNLFSKKIWFCSLLDVLSMFKYRDHRVVPTSRMNALIKKNIYIETSDEAFLKSCFCLAFL